LFTSLFYFIVEKKEEIINLKTIPFQRCNNFLLLFIKHQQRKRWWKPLKHFKMDETRHNLNAEIPISSTMSMDDAEMPSPSSVPIDLSTTPPSSTSTTSSTINISQQQPSMDILNSLNSFPHMSQPSTSHQLPAFPQLNELLYSTLLQSGQQQVLGERLVNSCFDGELSQMLQSAITSTAPLLQQQPQQPNIADSVFWEHWMCLLATNLSPQQWQAYKLFFLPFLKTIDFD
jgi:hypothetical protein